MFMASPPHVGGQAWLAREVVANIANRPQADVKSVSYLSWQIGLGLSPRYTGNGGNNLASNKKPPCGGSIPKAVMPKLDGQREDFTKQALLIAPGLPGPAGQCSP